MSILLASLETKDIPGTHAFDYAQKHIHRFIDQLGDHAERRAAL